MVKIEGKQVTQFPGNVTTPSTSTQHHYTQQHNISPGHFPGHCNLAKPKPLPMPQQCAQNRGTQLLLIVIKEPAVVAQWVYEQQIKVAVFRPTVVRILLGTKNVYMVSQPLILLLTRCIWTRYICNKSTVHVSIIALIGVCLCIEINNLKTKITHNI